MILIGLATGVLLAVPIPVFILIAALPGLATIMAALIFVAALLVALAASITAFGLAIVAAVAALRILGVLAPGLLAALTALAAALKLVVFIAAAALGAAAVSLLWATVFTWIAAVVVRFPVLGTLGAIIAFVLELAILIPLPALLAAVGRLDLTPVSLTLKVPAIVAFLRTGALPAFIVARALEMSLIIATVFLRTTGSTETLAARIISALTLTTMPLMFSRVGMAVGTMTVGGTSMCLSRHIIYFG
jgi:hypothetical protein